MRISAQRARARVAAGVVGALIVADAVAAIALPGHSGPVSGLDLAVSAPAPAGAPVTAPPAPLLDVPASTLLAAPKGTIPTSSSPGGPATGSVGLWYGWNLVLPVVAQQAGWSEVRLPQRPNQSTAWVQSSQVTFSSTPYFILLSLSAMHLTVYQDGHPIMRFPAGVGLPATPTVTGQYFVAVHQPKPDPVLGPVVLDLSAHSDAIQDWEGSNDAIIAIHGPVDAADDAKIGTTGARVSNGCIRLHTADQEQLSVIPVGTPVDISN